MLCMVDIMFAQLSVCKVEPDLLYMYDIDFEIFSFRQLSRRSCYSADPHDSKKHTALQGKVLEESVIHFDEMYNQNKSECCVTQIAGMKERTSALMGPVISE